MKKERITVFFAVDDNYVDFLLITLASIVDNAKDERYSYNFKILHSGLSQASRKKLSKFNHHRFKITYFKLFLCVMWYNYKWLEVIWEIFYMF